VQIEHVVRGVVVGVVEAKRPYVDAHALHGSSSSWPINLRTVRPVRTHAISASES
jgi:hypothetical protein